MPNLYAAYYNDNNGIADYKKQYIYEDTYFSPEPFLEPADAKGFAYELSQKERFDNPPPYRGGELREAGAEMPEDFIPRGVPAFPVDPDRLVAFGSRAKQQERAGPERDADAVRVV